MLFRNILLVSTLMLASSFAAPLDRNQPSITATPEHVELFKNVKACSEEFLSSLKTIPAGKEVRFAECVKMIQEFTQSLVTPSNSVVKRALDATNGVDVFFDARDRFEKTAKSWENSNLVCGVTKQKGGKDICGCNKGYCWRRCHGGVGIISFGIGYAAPPQSALEWCFVYALSHLRESLARHKVWGHVLSSNWRGNQAKSIYVA
ncbi:hypothetical protein K493DRAFT_390423 [Basidiobolus meristosporus CBS 931.73]|uniref:Pectinesterase inhibitor domain-containing protein n=1 Tax=Basidiobolus meristosporus CBS 931.73 TaxID=1314790 RepID=A0A1Y1X2H8_9FUNG|nr:hypothetical protein K493DRAFT_390423 [Basidiobolus meristosporus CBS 931.73]|eukprot:ORX79912.1 hypothetical protein K493DRAFT_390423 [Basidiobolus meristosporus CBS 931.73]